MPYNPDGSFSLINEFSTGTAPNNQFPPQVGVDLDDIAAAISAGSTDNPYLEIANNLSDLNSASTARTNLGLGTSATFDVGTGADNVVQLDGNSKLPAVNGSQLTNLPSTLVAGSAMVLNPYAISTTTTQAHGLSKAPIFFDFLWECLTANLNYSVGDKVRASQSQNNSVFSDTTNFIMISGSALPILINKTTFANSAIVAADWQLTVTPYGFT